MFVVGMRVWRRAGLLVGLAALFAVCPAAFASSNAYVINGFGSISQYTVAANGTLSLTSSAIVATGTDPVAIALSADGKSAYVTSYVDNTVSQYTVAANGTLSPKSPETVATGSHPAGLALSADGRAPTSPTGPTTRFRSTRSQRTGRCRRRPRRPSRPPSSPWRWR